MLRGSRSSSKRLTLSEPLTTFGITFKGLPEFMLTKALTGKSLNHFKWVKCGKVLVEELQGWMK